MKKTITFLIGAAIAAPLYLSTPAQAQDYPDHIQRLEEQVQNAKARGDWGSAGHLERQLNVERLRYQRAHGLGEYSGDSANYYRFNLNQNPGYYYPGQYRGYYNRGYYNQNRGYYDQWGNWRRY